MKVTSFGKLENNDLFYAGGELFAKLPTFELKGKLVNAVLVPEEDESSDRYCYMFAERFIQADLDHLDTKFYQDT